MESIYIRPGQATNPNKASLPPVSVRFEMPLFTMNCVIRLIAALMVFSTIVAGKLVSVNREYDQDTAASDHHYGRVHIKVFRGPGHEHHFAPHGYWIKQPADDHHDG